MSEIYRMRSWRSRGTGKVLREPGGGGDKDYGGRENLVHDYAVLKRLSRLCRHLN
jgi:hypothetical protein